MKLPRTLLLACLGAAPLCAQQVETKTDTQKSATGAGNASATGAATAAGSADGVVKTDKQSSTIQAGQRPPHGGNGMLPQPQQQQPEQKAVAYIGVLTREVPTELRAQFSLADGFGLLVDEVMPDSPALAAGLKMYDVLVKFEDQQLVNMEQFMSLVRSKKKGDVVQLDVITGGKETKVPVTLGEHLVAARETHQRFPEIVGGMPPGGMQFFNDGMLRGGEHRGGFQHQGQNQNQNQGQNQGQAMREQMERFQLEIREYQKRVQEWSKNGGQGPMPQAPMLNLPGAGAQQPHGGGAGGVAGGGGGGRHHNGHQPQAGIIMPPGVNMPQFNMQMQTTASVSRRDDSGEYTLKTEDGKKIFVARPNNGPERSWPVNNDAERQAVPKELRDKLQMMDGATNGIRIEINPGNILPGAGMNGPAAPVNPATPPPAKGKTTSA
ncbi:S1C family serine protease [Prosthecobacter sp.]|uniref:S1C family serine protease n=1 Tax=Prosthecobacter sp. TaxID=1965333 RepID=UPI003783F73A